MNLTSAGQQLGSRRLAAGAAVTALIALSMAWPFFPGAYDGLALPLSTMVQGAGVVGLLLVPIGFMWFFAERRGRTRNAPGVQASARRYLFAVASCMVGAAGALMVSIMGFALAGPSLAVLTAALTLAIAWRVIPALRRIKAGECPPQTFVPHYLIALPLASVLMQVVLGGPLTSWSRRHAIASSSTFIQDIERYRAKNGTYPVSLAAMWKDYYPDVVGVEKFHYARAGDAYNLFFEQPRFLLDRIGTREWVVYNPTDDHRMYSHTSWFLLLTPEQQETSQGWYEARDAGVPHWKSFWFD